MRFKKTFGYVLATALIGATAAAAAPADTIKARQDLMKGFGADVKTITDQLKTATPDKAAVAAAFMNIAAKGKDVASRFPAGTGPDTGVKMRAKPEIWTNGADFKAASANFMTVSAAIGKTAKEADVDTLKGQAKALGDACGACHTKFREAPPPAAK